MLGQTSPPSPLQTVNNEEPPTWPPVPGKSFWPLWTPSPPPQFVLNCERGSSPPLPLKPQPATDGETETADQNSGLVDLH